MPRVKSDRASLRCIACVLKGQNMTIERSVLTIRRVAKLALLRASGRPLAGMMAVAGMLLLVCGVQADDRQDIDLAMQLAKLLQAGRTVISNNQSLINDPEKGDKGLTGDAVLAAAMNEFKKQTSLDPMTMSPASREGRLLRAEMAAIKEVVDENQGFINMKGVGFKGFIPAIFARLVTERLQDKVGSELQVKVTAPPELVRNRKSRPDAWEQAIIKSKFEAPDWSRGQIHSQAAQNLGREAFRVMVPEYYTASCLSCHGQKKGDVDITGYPKEGANEGDLGGVISITLFRNPQ
jgi:Protein of unknown function (DUF3365)